MALLFCGANNYENIVQKKIKETRSIKDKLVTKRREVAAKLK